MAKANVEKSLYWHNLAGEMRPGFRHPVDHHIVFDDAPEEADAPEVLLVPDVVEPEVVKVEVEDIRPEASSDEEVEDK